MNSYRYRIYYEWQGPSKSDIFAEEKTPEEVERAFERLPTEFGHRLWDQEASIEVNQVAGKSSEVILLVSTLATEEEVKNALLPTLQDWRLFGSRLD